MPRDVTADVIRFLWSSGVRTLDLTGGAPELHPEFRSLVSRVRSFGVEVVDRCNLTVLEEPGQEDLAKFLAVQGVRIVASLPCHIEDAVDRQRGIGTYRKSIRALQTLNHLGYGQSAAGLVLDLVYNPPGASLPSPQQELERAYKAELSVRYGIAFNRLYAIANMPIGRFAKTLISAERMQAYLELLRSSHCDQNLGRAMCQHVLSINWQGYVFDCDFNQLLGLPLRLHGQSRSHIRDLLHASFEHTEIQVAGHCFGCTAGQGSSCTGALLDVVPRQESLLARPPLHATFDHS